MGWTWFQNTGTDFYKIVWRPYITSQLSLKYWLEIQRFMQQQFEISLAQFQTYIFYSFIFKQTGQVCFGFGWGSDAVQVKLGTLFDFQDCYKTLIDDLCDWNKTFLGRDARWIDECKPSTGSSLVTVQDWLLAPNNVDQSLIGGTAIDGRGCWQFAEWTKWTPYVAQIGFDAIKATFIDPASHIDMDFESFVDSARQEQVANTV